MRIDGPSATRRQFLAASTALALVPAVAGQGALPPDAALGPILESPRLPEPEVGLPTDGIPREGPKKRLAAITTCWFKYSHADDIITKFIEGYGLVGRIHLPHCDVASIHIEQFPETDIGRGMAARYEIPLFDSPAAALTLGGDDLAVDGVLLIGEHGEYAINEKGQKLYPRRRLFGEIVRVFRAAGRGVPVYNDKHLSYSWPAARWMYDQSRALGFPMMAGSSVPVAWRRPPMELRPGARLREALAVAYNDVEILGYHGLECLQAFAERRAGGETGIRSVRCLSGAAAWRAADQGLWSRELLEAALATIPQRNGRLEDVDREATVFLVDYTDGFRGAVYVSPEHVEEFAFAARVEGVAEPAATWCYLPKPQRDHFSFLCNHIEAMFLTGQPSYPVERTLLVTGALAFLMDSRHAGGAPVPTPDLAGLGYRFP
jgi:hypothetical protein